MSCFVVVECNEEGCKAEHDMGADTKPQAQKWARQSGWICHRFEDWCPEHTADH